MTPKQEKLVKILEDNLINPNNTKTLKDMLLEAGYSESMAISARQAIDTEGVQEGLKPFVDVIVEKRDKAIKAMGDEKFNNSSARDLASIIDILTKNHQLLTGGATERSESLTEEQVNELIKRRAKEMDTSRQT